MDPNLKPDPSYMNIVMLSAGHYPAAPGACWPPTGENRFCEHAEAALWVGQIGNLVRNQFPVVEVPTGPLEDKVAWMNAYRIPDGHRVALSAEIHFNSNEARRGSGCEVLYYPGSKRGQRAAQLIQDGMAVIYRDRGVQEGWYRGDKPGRIDYVGDVDGDEKLLAFLSPPRFPSVIIEPEFIFNQAVIETTRNDACALIAEAIIKFCNTLG
jgi:N-acetylmuramoyl-L-alanine amidase